MLAIHGGEGVRRPAPDPRCCAGWGRWGGRWVPLDDGERAVPSAPLCVRLPAGIAPAALLLWNHGGEARIRPAAPPGPSATGRGFLRDDPLLAVPGAAREHAGGGGIKIKGV